MYIVVRNPVYRLIALAATLALFAIIYFAIIKPDQNTANSAVTQGEQQVQQALSSAAKANPGSVPAGVTSLASCIAAAGTNSGALQACAAKFKQ
jgi:hypothetical protein